MCCTEGEMRRLCRTGEELFPKAGRVSTVGDAWVVFFGAARESRGDFARLFSPELLFVQ
jgi:hypothetical protein